MNKGVIYEQQCELSVMFRKKKHVPYSTVNINQIIWRYIETQWFYKEVNKPRT